MPYIELKNVSKKLKNTAVLSNINLSLQKGKVYGFVGENGSGKTMLLRAIAGLMHPEGNVFIDNIDIYQKPITQTVGIILENIGLWDNLSAMDNLKMLNSFSKNKISNQQIKSAISAVGLDCDSDKPFKKFSLGMKQKLCIAQAIMAHPDIIMLDEPTNALDEKSIKIFRQIIENENKRGATVLIASHSAEDISLLCTEVYRMKNGRIERINNDC